MNDLTHEFDSSLTCNYCGVCEEKTQRNETCPVRVAQRKGMNPTPPVTPLPIAVELASDLEAECISVHKQEWDGAKAAAIIDARVRPLVEALREVVVAAVRIRGTPDERPDYNIPRTVLRQAEDALASAGDDTGKAYVRSRAALRAAGAE